MVVVSFCRPNKFQLTVVIWIFTVLNSLGNVVTHQDLLSQQMELTIIVGIPSICGTLMPYVSTLHIALRNGLLSNWSPIKLVSYHHRWNVCRNLRVLQHSYLGKLQPNSSLNM